MKMETKQNPPPHQSARCAHRRWPASRSVARHLEDSIAVPIDPCAVSADTPGPESELGEPLSLQSLTEPTIASTFRMSVDGDRSRRPSFAAPKPRHPWTARSMNTAIDLFAGAGGLSTGLRVAGFDVRGAVELDPTSAATYRANHPSTHVVVRDIRSITGPWLLREVGLERGELDLLTGCPPCQGFSSLRTRRRATRSGDPRNDLVQEVLRLIRSIRPRAVVLENVPGLAQNPRFSLLRSGLTRSGYSHDFTVVDATRYGVPQRRKRLVLLALRGQRPVPVDWAAPTGIVFRTVRDTIAQLPPAGGSGDPLHDAPERRSRNVLARIQATPKDGGSRRDVPEEFALDCHLASDGYSDVYGRMAWDSPSPTITSGCHNPSKGRFLHPQEDRAITLREAALLQTFPPSYQFDLSRGKEHVARQIGNAFPPRLIEPIATRLAQEVLS